MGQDFSDLLVKTFKEYGEERPNELRMSNIGQPLRKLWYSVKGFRGEVLNSSTKTKFLYGHFLEHLFVFLAIEAGHTVERLQEHIEVDGIPGHLDAIIDGVLVDFKSASTFSYKKFTSGDLYSDDPFGYVAQLKGYQQGTGVDRAGWFIIDKVLGNFVFVELKGDNGYDIHERIATVKQVVKSDVPPERCYSDEPNDKTTGNRKLCVSCQYCEHKSLCWNDANDGRGLELRFYSNGPRWFTKLVKEPVLGEARRRVGNRVVTSDEFDLKEDTVV